MVFQDLINKLRGKNQSQSDLGERLSSVKGNPEELARKLNDLDREEQVDLFLNKWPDLDNELREQIRVALEHSGLAGRWLEDCRHWEASKRLTAIEVVRVIAPDGCGPVLMDLLGHKDGATQMAAVEALSNLADRELVDGLIDALDKSKQYLPARVAQVLVNCSNLSAPLLVQAYPFASTVKKGYIIEILAQLGDDVSHETLLTALGDNAHEVRVQAAQALGQLGLVRGIEPLIKALADESPKVRAKAAKALGMLKAEVAAAALEEAARDEDWLVRDTEIG
ncbi:MAG: HEAT repeat domain-containing protein, partial [Clostridia bacterium]|nr:HEAT repeat domain-containing protein [Clostridia bacterium]